MLLLPLRSPPIPPLGHYTALVKWPTSRSAASGFLSGRNGYPLHGSRSPTAPPLNPSSPSPSLQTRRSPSTPPAPLPLQPSPHSTFTTPVPRRWLPPHLLSLSVRRLPASPTRTSDQAYSPCMTNSCTPSIMPLIQDLRPSDLNPRRACLPVRSLSDRSTLLRRLLSTCVDLHALTDHVRWPSRCIPCASPPVTPLRGRGSNAYLI